MSFLNKDLITWENTAQAGIPARISGTKFQPIVKISACFSRTVMEFSSRRKKLKNNVTVSARAVMNIRIELNLD